mgnify:CR=1 FL=1
MTPRFKNDDQAEIEQQIEEKFKIINNEAQIEPIIKNMENGINRDPKLTIKNFEHLSVIFGDVE